MPPQSDFPIVFENLKSILQPYAPGLSVTLAELTRRSAEHFRTAKERWDI